MIITVWLLVISLNAHGAPLDQSSASPTEGSNRTFTVVDGIATAGDCAHLGDALRASYGVASTHCYSVRKLVR
jgi:hypothetical protein